MLLDLSRANSAMEGMLDDGHLSEEINKIGVAEDSQDDEIFAPIIIGAGQGTTGTHLFAEATCRLGFVSLHYGIGCFPENVFTLKEPKLRFSDVVNSSTHESSNLNDKTRPPSCPISISPMHKHYQSLLKHHTRLSKGYVVSMMGKNETNPNDTKNDIINSLEEIIAWGKRHKVVLALHDTPYPLLMPEILKLVQKYYGGGKTHGNLTSIEADRLEGSFGNKTIHIENDQGSHASILHNSTVQNEYITVKPIILLSERKSADYVSRRIKGHGSYSYICQPTELQLRGITSNNMQNSIPNATSVMPPSSIAIEKMNPITLEGGAFDLKGCFNTFTSIHSELNLTHPHSLRIDQIFYSFKKANRLGHKQFIIDTMQNYQVTVRELAMFSYDMFLQENKTSANDLSTWIKQSMIESLVKEDGHMRMNVGMDFLGFDSFFKANEFEVEVRRGHRRRHYGDSYVDSVFSLTADSRLVNGSDANSTPPSRAPKMLRFHLWSMQLMASLDGEKVCPDN